MNRNRYNSYPLSYFNNYPSSEEGFFSSDDEDYQDFNSSNSYDSSYFNPITKWKEGVKEREKNKKITSKINAAPQAYVSSAFEPTSRKEYENDLASNSLTKDKPHNIKSRRKLSSYYR